MSPEFNENDCQAVLNEASQIWHGGRKAWRDDRLRVGKLLLKYLTSQAELAETLPEGRRAENNAQRGSAVAFASAALGISNHQVRVLVQVWAAVNLLSDAEDVGQLPYTSLRWFKSLIERPTGRVYRAARGTGGDMLASDKEEWQIVEPVPIKIALFRHAVRETWNCQRVYRELKARGWIGLPQIVPPAETIKSTSGGNQQVPAQSAGKMFTTGEIAKIVKCAPRTVSKWFDSGDLRGYRLPNSSDRRVPQGDLVNFLERSGMPIPESILDSRCSTLFVGGEPVVCTAFASGYAPCELTAAQYVVRHRVNVVVVDLCIGRSESRKLARLLQPSYKLVALANEDEGDEAELYQSGFAVVLRKPVTLDEVVSSVLASADCQSLPAAV